MLSPELSLVGFFRDFLIGGRERFDLSGEVCLVDLLPVRGSSMGVSTFADFSGERLLGDRRRFASSCGGKMSIAEAVVLL